MKAAVPDRCERLRAMLADLEMPGALETIDGVLAQADCRAVTAGEAIEQVLHAQIMLCNNRRFESASRQNAGAVRPEIATVHGAIDKLRVDV